MIVVVAHYLPDAVRGKMKLWFIEPTPNTFVSGVKDHLAKDIINLLMSHCPSQSGLIIFEDIPKPPFYRIHTKGISGRSLTNISGLQLIFEKYISSSSQD